MAAAKTQATALTLGQFLAKAVDPSRHEDCRAVAAMMQKATGEAPVMWGNIVGFGRYRYLYESGREGVWPVIGFAPRKTDLTLYITPGLEPYQALLSQLGKHKTGKSCLYIKRLADVDVKVLQQLIDAGVKAMAPKRLPASD